MTLRVLCLLLLSLASPLRAGEAAQRAPMLATVYEHVASVSDYLISEKLDGVRGRWDGTTLRSRSGNVIHAPQWFTEGWPAVPMEGELWIARGRFAQVSGTVRALQPDDGRWRRVRFMVFDLPAHPGRFAERAAAIRRLVNAADVDWLEPVVQFRLDSVHQLQARLDAVVAAGGEGLMLHHRGALYRAGRSDHLLKLKPYADAEARVVGHTRGEGKYQGMLGALIVERADGLRFRLGSGFTDRQRAAPPPVGSWVTYRYSGLTVNGVPRFARFLRVREDGPPPVSTHSSADTESATMRLPDCSTGGSRAAPPPARRPGSPGSASSPERRLSRGIPRE